LARLACTRQRLDVADTMRVPSLSVSVHDRYGPEIRDKIGEKLREPLASCIGRHARAKVPR
jgi:hypothetical protein